MTVGDLVLDLLTGTGTVIAASASPSTLTSASSSLPSRRQSSSRTARLVNPEVRFDGELPCRADIFRLGTWLYLAPKTGPDHGLVLAEALQERGEFLEVPVATSG